MVLVVRCQNVDWVALVGQPENEIPRPGTSAGGDQSNNYWSSTTIAGNPNNAWNANFNNGNVDNDDKANNNYVRAVRGGS